MAKKKKRKIDPAAEAFHTALSLLNDIPILGPLYSQVVVLRHEGGKCPPQGWAVVTSNGEIHVHPARRAEPEEWVYIAAHCLLHLGFGHFREQDDYFLWNLACDVYLDDFLSMMKIGRAPSDMGGSVGMKAATEDELYRRLIEEGIPETLPNCGTAGRGVCDMIMEPVRKYNLGKPPDWQKLFGKGVSGAVSAAIERAANSDVIPGQEGRELTQAQRARRWFISSYPLLGALAASLEIIEDNRVCVRENVRIAAVDARLGEIYLNPFSGLDEEEYRFVVAHELLHVSLGHHARCRGRDPFFWNVACDFVINGWLLEMDAGKMPGTGILHDRDFNGLSAESVYDRIVTDLRRYRKIATLRGTGLGDILYGSRPEWWKTGEGVSRDEFYRRCLVHGLEYHVTGDRGYLPAGLIEEIRALAQPPISWDVELARWFDQHFSPVEKYRTYARPSRRQSATPDIPRPSLAPAGGAYDGRTYGVVLDTSGSMDRNLLAKALGTIASYSMSRDVPLVRVFFADADYYDQGYMSPEDIAGRVKVKGRGGTILQPAINALEKAEDFPEDGPVLIITDCECDRLHVKREHAYVIPLGKHLPFVPKGKVFYID